jgi:hypothetical protein
VKISILKQSLTISKIRKIALPWSYYFVFIFGSYLYQLNREWLFLGKQSVNFGDLRSVLNSADCSMNIGRLVYENRQAEEMCNNYIYGYPLLKLFNFFNIKVEQADLVGIFFMATFSAIAAYFLVKASQTSVRILIIICLFSPPVTLLIQRANIDLFILIAVIFSAFLLSFKKYELAYLGAVIMSSFKFYPSILAMFYLILVRPILRRILWSSFLVLVCFSMIFDLLSISKLPWDARNMFGNIIWGEYLVFLVSGENTHSNYVMSSIIGVLLIAVPTLVFVRIPRIFDQFEFSESQSQPAWTKSLFLTNSIVFLSCYFSGLSIDYRLVFLLISVVCMFQLCVVSQFRNIIVVVSLLVSLFASYNSGDLQVFGDFAILVLTISIFMTYLRNFRSIKNMMLSPH